MLKAVFERKMQLLGLWKNNNQEAIYFDEPNLSFSYAEFMSAQLQIRLTEKLGGQF